MSAPLFGTVKQGSGNYLFMSNTFCLMLHNKLSYKYTNPARGILDFCNQKLWPLQCSQFTVGKRNYLQHHVWSHEVMWDFTHPLHLWRYWWIMMHVEPSLKRIHVLYLLNTPPSIMMSPYNPNLAKSPLCHFSSSFGSRAKISEQGNTPCWINPGWNSFSGCSTLNEHV